MKQKYLFGLTVGIVALLILLYICSLWYWTKPPQFPTVTFTPTVITIPSPTKTAMPTQTSIPAITPSATVIIPTITPTNTPTLQSPTITPTPSSTPCRVVVTVHHPIFDTLYISACRYLPTCKASLVSIVTIAPCIFTPFLQIQLPFSLAQLNS